MTARHRVRLGLLAAALLAPGPASAYVRTRTDMGAGVPIAWPRRCIGFHLNERGSEDLTVPGVEKATGLSLGAWTNVQCSDEELSYQGLTNVELVGYAPGETNVNELIFQEGNAWEHPAQIIALTTVTFCSEVSGSLCDFVGKVLDADIEMNGRDFTFTTTPLPGKIRYDVQNTVTHELGHFLGLDHSLDPSATMYATAPPGEREKQTLADDDIEGLCAIYPHVTPVPACEPLEVVGPYEVDDPLLGTEGGGSTAGGSSGDGGCAASPRGGAGPWALALFGLAAVVRRHRRRRG